MMRKRLTAFAVAAVAWLLSASASASTSASASASASAQEAVPTTSLPSLRAPEPAPERAPDPALPRYSLSFSPAYLAVPMGEVFAEMRVRDKVGVGAVAGMGWLTFTASPLKTHLIIYQLGMEGRYYVLGNFRHGMQLGFQVSYLHLSSPFQNQVRLSSDALSMAPFMGYKYTMKVGFTFETQLGYDYLLARGTFDSETSRAGESVVLFDIRVGWSF